MAAATTNKFDLCDLATIFGDNHCVVYSYLLVFLDIPHSDHFILVMDAAIWIA